MKSLYKNFVKGGFLGAIVLLGATACSDDHFDVKNQPGYGGTQTLWQSIEANPELTQAAEILKATRVMKDEDDKRATLTYAEWLNQPMEATVWLPKNGTFDNQKYLDMLQEAKDSLAAGNQKASLRIEFMVVNQFVRNHISLFSHSSVQTRKQIRLTNTKLCFFDPANSEFNGVKYDPAATVYCSNGALYTLEAASPFANNIFDFMDSEGYIRRKADESISSKDFYEIYRMWCEENSLAPLKARSFSDAMIANAKKFNLEHCNNITNSAGRRVWGFMGVEAIARPHINGFYGDSPCTYVPEDIPEEWRQVE